MKTFIVNDGPAAIGAGAKLKLTAAQLAARAHNVNVLEKEEGGRTLVEAKVPLQFKAGETVQLDGEPPKGISEVLVDVEKLKPAEIAAIKTRAKAGTRPKKAAPEKKAARRG